MNNFQEELVIENDKLVHYFVRKLKVNDMKNYEYDDLVQIGRIGLIKAAKTYNGSVKFVTYASRCINNELLMFFRKGNKNVECISIDAPVSIELEDFEVTLGDMLESPNTDLLKQIGDLYDIEKVFNVVLNTFETRDILIWLYTMLGKKQVTLAKNLRITQSYISRLKSGIYIKVRKTLEQKVDFEEMYHVNVDTNKCTFSFEVSEPYAAEFLVLALLKEYGKNVILDIIRNLGKVNISFSSIEEAIPVITLVVECIAKYSIKLIKN